MVLTASGGGEWVLHLLRRCRPRGDAAHPGVDVERPVAALGELTVADDVDAGLDLLAHDLVDGGLEAVFVGGLVVGLAGLDQLEEFHQFRRAWQTPDVGAKDAILAGNHAFPPETGVLTAFAAV